MSNYLSKENVEGMIELSLLQESLIKANEAPQAVPHFTKARYRVAGDLRIDWFQQALDQVVAAHPVLRSVFRSLKNRTVQVILKQRPIPVRFIKLDGVDPTARKAVMEDIDQAHSQPFPVSEGPLMRFSLIQTEAAVFELLWSYDHFIADERSSEWIWQDLLQAYREIEDGRLQSDLSRPHFKRYVDWLAQQNWTPAKQYWRDTLDNADSTARIAAYSPSECVQRSAVLELPAEQSRSLEQFARGHGVTSEALLYAGWSILLQLYSGEQDILFGHAGSGRPTGLPEADRMLGGFQNTLPFRVIIEENKPLGEFLSEIQHQLDAIEEFGYLPLATVVSYADLPETETSSWFETVVSVRDEAAPRSGGGLAVEAVEASVHQAGQPIRAHVALADRWRLRLAAETDKYPLEQMSRQLVALLDNMVKLQDGKLNELQLVSEEERHRLSVDFNRSRLSGGPLDKLAHQAVEEQAARQPEAIAAVCGDREITYAALNAKANRLAAFLREQGIGRDDRIALFADRSIEMLIGILGVLKAGGAYVPMDPEHPDQRLLTILESCTAKVILTQQSYAMRSIELAGKLASSTLVLSLDGAVPESDQVVDGTDLEHYSGENPICVNEPSDLANIFFTSGSTGTPKGAMVEHIGMLNHLWAKIDLLKLSQQSAVVQNAPHFFDISVWQFLAPLMVGGKVLIYPNAVALDPVLLLESAQRDRATVLEMVPAMIEMVLQVREEAGEEKGALPDLQFMLSTGEGLPVPLCNRWLHRYPGVVVINAYGPTECSDDVTHMEITAPVDTRLSHVPVGSPIPNFRVYLLDKWLRPVPMGCMGEMYITGIGVGRGYLNDPDRTAQAFVPNRFHDGMGERMYRTGDLAFCLQDGNFVHAGRVDHQVKVRGRRIELGEIETVLRSHPQVAQAFVIVRPDIDGNNRILAYTVLNKQQETADLKGYLQQYVPDYMVPAHVMTLEALPLNRNGKVDRKALPEPEDQHSSRVKTVPPRSPMETALAGIWQEVLGVSDVGIDDNFFDLGGHSIKTVQVRSRLKQSLGVHVELKTLFEQQTIRELAALLEQLPCKPQAEQTIPPAAVAEHYPMSHAQQRLFFLQKMDETSCSYNMPVALSINGKLQTENLQAALQTIVDRHESLRTTFRLIEGQPVQVIAAWMQLPLTLEDLSQWDADAREARLAGIEKEELETPFDLTTGPVFRLRLIQLDEEQHLLWLNMHHIVSDFWSWQVLMQEFTALYEAYAEGKAHPLPPLGIQYKDYAQWQNKRLEEELAREEQYWLNRLSGELPILKLPTDRPRPPIQQFDGDVVNKSLAPELAKRIEQLAAQTDSTLFMVLLAATTAFLHRLSGQDDLIVGTPEAGRNLYELEGLIGCFINTLPLRVDVSGRISFLELAERCKQASMEAYEHSEYPFDLLVERLNPVRDLSMASVFSTMFQVNRKSAGVSVAGLDIEPLPLDSSVTKYDLSISFTEQDNGLECHFEYCTSLFDRATVERWINHFEVLLQSIVDQPDQLVDVLPILTGEEKQLLLTQWNKTEVELATDICVHHLFEAQAARTPDATAVIFRGGSLSYRELDDKANQLARRLCRLGVRADDLVGISMNRSLEMFVGLLGILKAGGAYVPLDPAFPRNRLAHMIEDSQLSFIVTERELASQLDYADVRLVIHDGGQEEETAALEESVTLSLPVSSKQEDRAYIIYTSGSTGKPKGVELTHRAFANLLISMSKQPGMTPDDILLSVTTMSFDIFGLECFLPLMTGARLHLAGPDDIVDGPALARLIQSSSATMMQGTPTTWRMLVESGWGGSPRMQVLSGGEPMPRELAAKLLAKCKLLWNMYGPTETTIYSTLTRVVEPDSIHIGHPLDNTRIYILDTEQQPVPIGVPGEIYIAGDGLARGYLHRPELTAEKFITLACVNRTLPERAYRSGDLARYLPDGSIESLGRIDQQVKIRGYRIELSEIESVLVQHAGVKEAVVLARNDVQSETCLVAYVVPQEDHAVSFEELRTHLAAFLPSYMVPSLYVELESMPVTPNSKIDRLRLPAPVNARAAGSKAFAMPRDSMELQMAQLWEGILKVSPIGIEDNFFEVGGHSLHALTLMSLIKNRFGVELPLVTLFRNTTIAALCGSLRNSHPELPCSTSTVVPIQIGNGSRVPLFIVHAQGGGVLSYSNLAKALGEGETVYGLQAVGYESDELPLASIEEMAQRYIADMKQVCPAGPYRVAGWSFGGAVAFEMASRLEEQGDRVAFVGLLDVLPLDADAGGEFEQWDERAVIGFWADEHAFSFPDKGQGDTQEMLAQLCEYLKQTGVLPNNVDEKTVHSMIRVMAANGNAMQRYRYTKPIQADIHLFRADATRELSVDPALWASRTTGKVHARTVTGTHNSIMTQQHVAGLAEELLMALDHQALQV